MSDMSKMSKTTYTVHAYRWGDRECHSYTVGVYSNKHAALKAADIEEGYRGGKYACEVLEWILDSGREGNHNIAPKTVKPLPAASTLEEDDKQATTNPAECECWNWCSDGLHRREELLAGHHFRCSKFEAEFRRRALELIAQLYEAMRDWGNEEDGVPTESWDVWRLAGSITTGKYQVAKKAGTA